MNLFFYAGPGVLNVNGPSAIFLNPLNVCIDLSGIYLSSFCISMWSKDTEVFLCMDKEVGMLLRITQDYKAAKANVKFSNKNALVWTYEEMAAGCS